MTELYLDPLLSLRRDHAGIGHCRASRKTEGGSRCYRNGGPDRVGEAGAARGTGDFA